MEVSTQQMSSKPILLAVLSLTLSAGLLSCASSGSFVEAEALELQHRLDSPTDVIVQPAVLRHDGDQVVAQWKVNSPRRSAGYMEWVAKHVGGDYRVTNRTDSSIGFAKQTDGDALYLQVAVEQRSEGVLVQYTLDAMPD
jgi:hypothetical protein